MADSIFIPRVMVDLIIANSQKPQEMRDKNLALCVKIPYRGYEVSVSMDTNHGAGDFCRSDLRLYKSSSLDGEDVTDEVLGSSFEQSVCYVTGETLKQVFALIDDLFIKAPVDNK